jgi:AraC-like DNA-binding protein
MRAESRQQSHRQSQTPPAGEARQHVVALLLNAADRRAVLETLGERATVVFCERSAELFRLATDLRADVVIADSRDIDGRRTAPALHSLRAARPLLQVVLYLDLSAPAVRSALEGWATGVVFRHEEDIGPVLRTAISRAPNAGSPGATLAASAALAPPEVRRFFTHCAWRAVMIGTARAAAEDVGIPYRTLARQLEAAGLPSPKVVLDWYRLLHAAWQMELSHANREVVAKKAGFSSGDVLAKRLRRYADLSWMELRERVGFNGLLMRFEALLGAHAETAVKQTLRATPALQRNADGASTERVSGRPHSRGGRGANVERPVCRASDRRDRDEGARE